MKKLVIVFALVALLLPMAFASAAPATSYQIWDADANSLTVFNMDSPYSGVCYQGGAEWYNGYCTADTGPTSQYQIRAR